jgi:hypothetical protein
VHNRVGVEKVVARGRFDGTAEGLAVFRSTHGLGGSRRRAACNWRAQEPHQPFDVPGDGCEEELFLNEPQPAQAQSVEADPTLELCE